MLDWLFGTKKQKQNEKKQKKSKSKNEQQSQDKWQYQFLIQFLNSPLWRVSILDFVDQYCIIFDNEQENKFQYTKIHNEFKKLVSSLFDGMMLQIGLDNDQLVKLLEKGFESKQKKYFNQLLLCDDFLKFKDLMVKRNKQLQKQAINSINGQKKKQNKIDLERNVIHQSLKLQAERKKKIMQEEEQMLQKVLELSKRQADERKQIEKMQLKAQNLQKIKKQQKQKIKDQKKKIQQKQKPQKIIKSPKTQNIAQLPPIKSPIKQQKISQEAAKKKQSKLQQSPQNKFQEQPKSQSSQQRKKRLMEQRQKIRKIKQSQRRKILEQQQNNPKKIQNIVLQDNGIHDSMANSHDQQSLQKISKEEIQRRKQIMKKIKNRIVQEF